jgi:adenylate kinase family enzyme
VQRISVVGSSGAGKSTLARHLAARLGLPHLELDSIYHQPGWVPLDAGEFAARVAAAVAADRWVIDGNYSAVRPLIWARADTVVWLDLPRRTVMRRLAWRTLRRVASRAELWNGNREQWRSVLSRSPDKSLLVWAWQHYPAYRQRYTAALADPANAHLTFVRVTGRADLRRLLA